MTSSLLQTLLDLLKNSNVSDIHLSPNAPIWLRRSGDMIALEDKNTIPSSSDLINLLSSIHYKSSTIIELISSKGGQDDFAANLGADLRVRIHVWISNGQINVAVRKLAIAIPQLDSLNLPREVRSLLNYPTGLVLVVGATGSGKSTTLAAFIDQLNTQQAGHIITLEDPIEYVHKDKKSRVRQRQIGGGDDCCTFAAGVVAALREDPDIIMVGEVRDQLTMQACLTASQTGHLVFATLHTNSAVETIERVLSFYPEKERDLARSVLSATLRGVVAQRLIKSTKDTRILAAELLLCTQAIRSNIAGNQLVAIEQTMETGRSEGQVTMNYCLQTLHEKGMISRDTAILASPRPEILEKRLK